MLPKLFEIEAVVLHPMGNGATPERRRRLNIRVAQLFGRIRVFSRMRAFPKHCILLWLAVFGGAGVCVASAQGPSAIQQQGPSSVAEQYLFNAANAERAHLGVPPLVWDAMLYRAAMRHAREMAARESISHQYAGEPDLAERAETAGVRFSVVAENVAEAPSAVIVHDAWMHSPDHRRNLLDDHVDRVAIAVLMRRGELYAVEDFDRAVESLSFDEQERQVASLLARGPGLSITVEDPAARRTCAMSTGYAGERRPWFVMRFSAGELTTLPDALKTRLASGRFHEVSVGACSSQATAPFTSYNIAVLLFP